MAILQECPICKARQRVANKVCKCGEQLDKARRSGRVRYWITYRLPGGMQRKEFVGASLEDARAADGKRKGQKREGRVFDMLPDTKKSFAELSAWFMELEKIKALKSYKALKRHVALINQTFGKQRISNLTREALQGFQLELRRSYSASYVDQIVDTIRWMITDALDAEIIGGDLLKPFRKLRHTLRKGANTRKRVLSIDEFRGLYEALKPHLKPVVTMAYWTGMRQGEILKLTWDRVDIAKRLIYLRAEDTKERQPKVIPIARPLRDVLLTLPGRAAEGYVMTYAGRPVRDITQGIEAACKAAGIAYGRFVPGGFIFHDMRHGFATYARKAGVPRNVIMAIMGHSGGKRDMNIRYDLVDESDLVAAIERLENYIGKCCQDVARAAGKP